MGIQHCAPREKRAPAYTCYQAYHNEGGAACQCMSATGVDEAVTALFLRAVTPAKVDLAVRALHPLEGDPTGAREPWGIELPKAGDEGESGKRRVGEEGK